MNWQSISFDWNQARAFLVTAEEGSLSAAARALGLTQPTLSRQVAALEEELGVALFERIGKSLSLTPAGVELLDHFRHMGEAAQRISLGASGQSQTIDGAVSITATDLMAMYHLPPVLRKIQHLAPELTVNIVGANDLRDLLRREADIAIRHVRPEQPDLIAKFIGDARARLYASTTYLERHGRPAIADDLRRHDFIGFSAADTVISYLTPYGLPLSERNIRITTESGSVILELVREGLGVSILSEGVAKRFPELDIVLPELEPFLFPVWLVTHRELHTSQRIRLVFDLLTEAFSAIETC